MPIFRYESLSHREQKELLGDFKKAFEDKEVRSDINNALVEVLTKNEVAMIIRRIQIAYLLENGYTYDSIQQILGTGSTKVRLVANKLRRGNGGLKKLVGAFGNEHKSRVQTKKQIPLNLHSMQGIINVLGRNQGNLDRLLDWVDDYRRNRGEKGTR